MPRQRSGNHERLACKGWMTRPLCLLGFQVHAGRGQAFNALGVVGVGKVLVDGARHDRTDAVDRFQPFGLGLGQSIERAEFALEQARRARADVRDVQRAQQPPQVAVGGRFDGLEQVFGRALAHAFERLDFFRLVGQCVEDIRRIGKQARGQKLPHQRFTQVLDVQTAARSKMNDLRLDAAAAARIGTAQRHFAVELHRFGAAHRTDRGRANFPGPGRPLRRDDTDHLRDDLAGLFHDHRIANADVFARDLFPVVQRGVLHRGLRQQDRIEARDRRDHAGFADVRVDPPQDGFGLFSLELVRDRPARRLAGLSAAVLLIQPIDFDHDAVGVVRQRVTLRVPLGDEGAHGVDVAAAPGRVLCRQAQSAAGIEYVSVRPKLRAFFLTDAVNEKLQAPPGDSGWGFQLKRSGRGIARVGICFVPGLFALSVNAGKLGPRQINLAADFQKRRHGHCPLSRRVQVAGQFIQGAQVGGDVFPFAAVAARKAAHEAAALEMQAHRRAVDFQLGHVAERFAFEQFPHAAVEIGEFRVVAGVVQREHRDFMRYRRELAADFVADALRGAVGCDQFRVGFFEVQKLAFEPVVIGVGDLWLVFHIIKAAVIPDEPPQLGHALAIVFTLFRGRHDNPMLLAGRGFRNIGLDPGASPSGRLGGRGSCRPVTHCTTTGYGQGGAKQFYLLVGISRRPATIYWREMISGSLALLGFQEE